MQEKAHATVKLSVRATHFFSSTFSIAKTSSLWFQYDLQAARSNLNFSKIISNLRSRPIVPRHVLFSNRTCLQFQDFESQRLHFISFYTIFNDIFVISQLFKDFHRFCLFSPARASPRLAVRALQRLSSIFFFKYPIFPQFQS